MPPFGVSASAGIPTFASVPFVSKIPAILLHKPSMTYTVDGFSAVDGVLNITAHCTKVGWNSHVYVDAVD